MVVHHVFTFVEKVEISLLVAFLGLSAQAEGAYVTPGGLRPTAAHATAAAARAGSAPPTMVTDVTFGDSSRKALMAGIDAVANAVKVTIGPRGRNVVIRRGYEDPVVINDGVSIASDVDLELPEEQVGAKLLLQACSQTDSRAGDGTTTSAVLTQAMVKAGSKLISNGAASVALQRGLNKAAVFFVEKIRDAAMPVTTASRPAATSRWPSSRRWWRR